MTPSEGPARGAPKPILLFLRMCPVWVFVDEVRHFVESFCACAGVSPERESQLALATHELMQNAITHSTSACIELRLAIDAGRDAVEVSLTNDCSPGAPEALRSRLAALQAEPPLASYLHTMAADPRARGGLGLARVRYEAQLELDVTTEAGRLTVKAFGQLNPPPLAAATGASHG
ncbi:ATP-binding protein [Anaeromyxobacter diazotrophicus]|uniref:Histidine kinase/HSP90-like ATPase domain-containing protein n=1 Tax=Anaeromyxobacter diazotrophicus TaxID=2590199 RepID=A0A7I9VJG2_9BACT|nr:ATP-binding protein [Anaeromyxobacter diazotrophicus]GEJ56503.1 hypothetical protein AMYX_12440 [Anaeromyxobacter diazotrophicus]